MIQLDWRDGSRESANADVHYTVHIRRDQNGGARHGQWRLTIDGPLNDHKETTWFKADTAPSELKRVAANRVATLMLEFATDETV